MKFLVDSIQNCEKKQSDKFTFWFSQATITKTKKKTEPKNMVNPDGIS